MAELDTLRTFGIIVLAAMAVSLGLAALLFILVVNRLKKIKVPPHAGFLETLRYTPLSVAILIDLLDFGLDILSAPVSWVILDRLGLRALRGFATIEALIPATQVLPTMTVSWFIARFTKDSTFRDFDIDPPPPDKTTIIDP